METSDAIFNDKDKEALLEWTGGQFTVINDYLRNGAYATKMQKGYVQGVHKALDKCATDDIYVRRGAFTDYITKLVGTDEWLEKYTMLKGITLTDKGFLATTPFTDGGGSFKDMPVEIFYKVPKGSKGGYLEGFTRIKGEKEMLFQSNTKMRIADIKVTDKSGGKCYTIYADMIGGDDE